MLRLTLICSLCLWLTTATAVNLDSLWGVWNDKTHPDTIRMKAMNKIAWNGYLFSQPDSAFYFAQILYELAEATDNKKKMADALNIQGISFGIRGNYLQAVLNFQRVLKISEEIGDKKGMAMSYNHIGNIYKNQNNYDQAIEYYEESLKLNKEGGENDGLEIANSLGNIGNICRRQGNYEKALEYHVKSLKIKEKTGNKRGIATSLSNIGAVYYKQENYKQALEYHDKSLQIYKEKSDKNGMSVSLGNIGLIYADQGNYSEALDMGKKAMALAQEVGAVKIIKEVCELLYDIYKKTGQPVKALEIQELYITMNDSLNRIENRDAAIKLEYQYKYEKEQAVADAKHKEEMSLAAEREKRQQLISYGTGAGLILVLVFAFLIYNRFKLTREQKKVIEQKNNHITESILYAKRIQDASLVSKQSIDKALDDYFIYFKPKDIVSGDFYWIHKLKDDYIMIAVADCTGHGVPGGFMSMMSTSLLNEIIIENGVTQVNTVLDTMRTQLIKRLRQHGDNVETMDGLDISLLLVDKKNRKIDFAAAGHKLYITGNGGCKEIRGDYYPVGYLFGNEKPFTKKELQLGYGETIYLTSDGFIDQFGGKNRTKYGRLAFKQLLISIKDKTMNEQKTIIEETMAEWKGDTEQVDDILVMGVRF